jgi:hypothetical protein
MDVSGGTVTMNKGDTHMSVGENSRSDLTLSGSAVMNTALLNVGYGSGARGNVTVNGGTLNVGGNIVAGINASGAVGNITVNGGTLNVTGQTQLGAAHAADAGSNAGDLIVKSGTFNGTGIGYVGNGIGSTGCLTVDGGLAKFTGALYIGANASSAGEVTVNGGTLQVGGSFYLGYYGASDAGTGATGNLTLNDGVINAGLTLGYGAFSSSVFTMNGGTFNTQTGYVNIGFSGAAEAVINNGTMNIHGTLRVAENTAGVTASLTIHNGTHIADIATPGSGGYHIIGGKGFGILNMDGGSLTVSSKVKLGRVAGATGTINLAGGSLSFGGLSIGNFNGGTGFVNISGGSLTTKALEMQTAGSKITFTIAGADFGSPFVINNTSDADIVIGAGLLVADLSGFAAADGAVDIILMTYNQINATPNDIEAALSSILDYGSQDASRFTNVSFVWKNALDPLKRELHLAFDYAAIPEPSTGAVLLGLLTLAFTRFRRR